MGNLEVTYLVKAHDGKSAVKVSKLFPSEYLCRQFINRARHSKKIVLLAVPNLGK